MQNSEKGKAVAKVGNRYLYDSYLANKIPSTLSKEDSVKLSNKIITRWVKDELLREKAELNLPDDEQNIDAQVENYRTSLLIHKYQHLLLNQKLDTSISNDEITKYYNAHAEQFKLDDNIAKVWYINIPKSAPKFYRISYWYQSDKDDDYNKLDEFCEQYANEYSLEDKWTYFKEINEKLPLNINNPQQYLKYNKYIISYDSLNYYYVRIHDHKFINDTTPLQFVSDKVRNVLLNKKKLNFLRDVENNMYENALNRNKIEIF